MTTSSSRGATILASLVAWLLLPSAALAGTPEPAVYPGAAFAPFASTGVDSLLTAGGDGSQTQSAAAAEGCNFYTRGDYVHKSSSANEASGHGWWENIDCPVALADVRIQLQQYYSDGTWRYRGSASTSRVYSGGGAGNRATGRASCNSSSLTSWRSVIDVDLVNYPDSPEVLWTTPQNLSCRN